jgi:aminoglycoside phosphotransferase (APT) family kinase protein
MPPAGVPVLLHGDFWPGNILWRDGRLSGVVDWEDAKIGDPLADLAISRLDTLLIYGRDASLALTRAYAKSSGISIGGLPYWDLLAALRAATAIAEWAAGFPALGRPDLTEERLREELRWFAAGALERVS